MSLFQSSVLKKHLATQDQDSIASAYEKYSTYFLNPQIQENIRGSKEEQFQEGFLRELFVNILGYTINPNPEYNLTTELKNIKDAKKTDGAVLKDGNALAVIELKGTDTKDLDKVTDQAFNYKNNQPECVYVVTSNFEKLRFYIHNAVQHEEFHLFALTFDQFKLLWLFLQKDNLLRGVPEKVKEESLLEEERVTKRLYKDYSAFKSDLWQDMCRNNSESDELELYKKSQKLLDRFLFIFFAEDKGLLPPNSISVIVEQWRKLKELDEYKPLYSRFQKYFGYMNDGFKGNNYEIHAYNGGLFKADPLLDDLTISDDVLEKHVLKLTEYDFETEVDTNILGHIFEHSLNEIENVRAQLAGEDLDKSKTKRKKDGVFYTPKYITKYIVDNTVGKLCEEKKSEIGIEEEEFAKDRRGRKTETLKRLDEQLKQYREWLLQLTICDPACGSGAFLNQALEFLMAEHRYVDELESQLLGYAMVFPDVENHILERNIFGVDINEESVEIARLSLWLRTAKKGRKLTSLSNNIKCGNSLIDDPKVAGDLAFNWQEQFPKVFDKGGFDVVIGNPPYVSANEVKKFSTKDQFDFLKSNYVTAKGTVDLYIYFFERGLKALRKNGCLAYITPNRFLSASYGTALRELLIEKYEIERVVDYSDKKVFPDASTYPVITFLMNRTGGQYFVNSGKFDERSKRFIGKRFPSSRLQIIDKSILGFLLNDKLPITEKVINQSVSLNDVGLINATSTASEADSYSVLVNEQAGYKLINTGTIDPYCTTWGRDKLTDKGKKYLCPYLPSRSEIISSNRQNLYSSPKIIISKIGLRCEAFFDRTGQFASINTNCIHSFHAKFTPEYILAWLNSKLYNYTFECLFDGLRMSGGYLLFSAPNLKSTSIKEVSLERQKLFGPLVHNQEDFIEKLLETKFGFVQHVVSKFSIEKTTKKLLNWPQLDFNGFLSELKKKQVNLSLEEEAEWLTYFNKKKIEANALQAEIDRVNKQIDQMVYELYGLNEEEVRIVEQAS